MFFNLYAGLLQKAGLAAICAGLYLYPQVSGLAQTLEPVSEEQLVRMALEQNAALLAMRQRTVESQALLRQAAVRPNPAVEFSFADGGLLGSSGEREFSVGYAHTIELGNKRQRRIDAARLAEELTQLQILDKERLLRADVRRTYTAALARRSNLETAAHLAEVNEEAQRVVQMRVDQGEAPRLETGLMQVELNRLKTDRFLMQTAVDRAISELQVLTGAGAAGTIAIAGALDLPRIDAPVETLIEHALAARPDLQAARIQEALAQAEFDLAEAEASPDAALFGSYTRSSARFDQFGLSSTGERVPLTDTDNIWQVGLAFDLPVSDRNQGAIEAARARQRAAALERDYLESIVRMEVQTAYLRMKSAAEMLDLFDALILDQSEANLEIVQTAYRFGELRFLDVLDEQRRLIEARNAYTGAMEEYRSAYVELESAVGLPFEGNSPIVEVLRAQN